MCRKALLMCIAILMAQALYADTVSVKAKTVYVKKEIPRFRIEVNGKQGFIDSAGKIVIKPQFDAAMDFHEGFATVRDSKRKWGFIDVQGRWLVKPVFGDVVEGFSEGMASVRKGGELSGKWGYIDKTGKFNVSPRFTAGMPFSDGLAAVAVKTRWGYIGKDGKFRIKPTWNREIEYDHISDFHEGLASMNKGDKWGYIDKTGRYIIPPIFEYADDFSDGLARVLSNGRYGYVDRIGRLVIPVEYGYADNFAEGLAVAGFGKDQSDKKGYIDKTGRWVVTPRYTEAIMFSEGLAVVHEGNAWICIDKTGKKVISLQGSSVGFAHGLAAVYSGTEDNPKLGYIDHSGRWVWKPHALRDESPGFTVDY